MNVIDPKVLWPYERYIRCFIKQPMDGRRMIKGVFKEKNTGKIIKGDNFSCIVFGHGKAEECYKGALAYFNYTRTGDEPEREFVSAKWEEGSNVIRTT